VPSSGTRQGTWQFGGEWGKRFGQAEVDELVRRASGLGINLIDTAECACAVLAGAGRGSRPAPKSIYVEGPWR